MILRFTIWVGLVVLAASTGTAAGLPEKKDFHLFLLVGQSNMAGRGAIEDKDLKPHPRVLSLGKNLEWGPAVAPLHFDKPKWVGYGPGDSFGRAIAEAHPDVTIGLIPCAVGGSPIDAWQEGAYDAQTKSHPWDDAIKRAKHALPFGQLKGILWHQGESDSKPELAEAYEEKLHDLIHRFRKTLDEEQVPFIAGQMGQFEERPWSASKQLVDAAHRRLPGKVMRTAFVNSKGLSHKGDEVHFDTESYRELGRRYAQAWFGLSESLGVVLANPNLPFRIERSLATQGFDGQTCWVHARAGTIPSGHSSDWPEVVMTLQKLQLSGSDVFYALHSMRTEDEGRHWSKPARQAVFGREKVDDRIEMTVCDFWPKWHEKTGQLLGTGQTVVYQDNRVKPVRKRSMPYATYDVAEQRWNAWKELALPQEARFENAGSGCVQRYDLSNGDILLPIYFKVPTEEQFSTTVASCRFDGETMEYVKHGNELTVAVKRGLYEPSLTKFGETFFLTMRNDDHGYVSVSRDGLQYSDPRKWTFDDGQDLGSYNTQQHWVTHEEGLYLCYTRKAAGNDHIFRHRAPLFIAQVDPESLQIIRSTEQILVPEFGARLGNFGVTEVRADETWITVTEWMQTKGPEWNDASVPVAYGADNRVWVVKLKWN